ncbi:hypothetical protein [Nocardioides pacificus]
MLRILSGLVTLVLLAACGAQERDFDSVVEDLEGHPSVTKVVEVPTEADANGPIQRPEASAESAVVYDERASCDVVGIECGAVLEVWSDADAARARAEYLMALQLGMSDPRGVERHYRDDHVLLRIHVGADGLTAQQADSYQNLIEGD